MTAKEIYIKETGDAEPNMQPAWSEWYSGFTSWMERRIEKEKSIKSELTFNQKEIMLDLLAEEKATSEAILKDYKNSKVIQKFHGEHLNNVNELIKIIE